MANLDVRKKQIMEHVKRTTELPQQKAPLNSDARKKQIMDHVKMTMG